MYKNLKELFKAICDAIREKEDSTEEIAHADIPQRISNLKINDHWNYLYWRHLNFGLGYGGSIVFDDDNESFTISGSSDCYTETFMHGTNNYDMKVPSNATQMIFKYTAVLNTGDAFSKPFYFNQTAACSLSYTNAFSKDNNFDEIGVEKTFENIFDLQDTSIYPYAAIRFGLFANNSVSSSITFSNISITFK